MLPESWRARLRPPVVARQWGGIGGVAGCAWIVLLTQSPLDFFLFRACGEFCFFCDLQDGTYQNRRLLDTATSGPLAICDLQAIKDALKRLSAAA